MGAARSPTARAASNAARRPKQSDDAPSVNALPRKQSASRPRSSVSSQLAHSRAPKGPERQRKRLASCATRSREEPKSSRALASSPSYCERRASTFAKTRKNDASNPNPAELARRTCAPNPRCRDSCERKSASNERHCVERQRAGAFSVARSTARARSIRRSVVRFRKRLRRRSNNCDESSPRRTAAGEHAERTGIDPSKLAQTLRRSRQRQPRSNANSASQM